MSERASESLSSNLLDGTAIENEPKVMDNFRGEFQANFSLFCGIWMIS
jgi:hypothetical protein